MLGSDAILKLSQLKLVLRAGCPGLTDPEFLGGPDLTGLMFDCGQPVRRRCSQAGHMGQVRSSKAAMLQCFSFSLSERESVSH